MTQTIQISVANLVAQAQSQAMLVSHNTGYQIQFQWDEAWEAYPVKTAVFVWTWKLETYSASVVFEGDTAAVPKLPGVDRVYVGLMAGDLHTTTPALICCQPSILAGGGQTPQAPEEDVYGRIMAMLNEKMEEVTAISVTESGDGTITMVNTLPGRTETLTLIPGENGDPENILYNGAVIPVTWGSGT